MYDTFVTPSEEQAARLVVATRAGAGRWGGSSSPRWPAPGALRSTALDMLRFLAANLDPASTPLAAQLERIQRPPAPAGPGNGRRARLADRPPARPARAMLWHNGGTNGFRSFVGVIRDAGIAVVVLGNTARSVDWLGLRLVRALATGAG